MNYLEFIKDKNKNQIKQFILFGLVVLIFSLILGLLCFFQNTNIKNNLYNSLPLSYHVLDDTVLADGREKINIVDYKSDSKNDLYCLDLFDIYIDAINKIKTLGNNTSYYNYTLCVYDELFGFDSMDFFKQYKMPLVDYKNFNYNNAVILPYSKHGEYLIGDTYNFYWTKEEFVVSGFYDDSIQYNFDDAENTFINKEVVFTSNDNLLELLEYNNTLISHSKLNNIEFVFNDYDKYKEFKANFNKQFLSFYDGTILLISSLDEIIINKINDSFLLIKLFLIIIAFVAIMIMYSFIVLLFNQNKKELFTLYSLGLNKKQMVILYQFYILVESIIFVLAGLIIAYVLANVIDYNIYQTQSELVAYLNRIAGKNVGDTSQNVFTFKDILKLFLAFIYSIAIISASALITTCKNLKSTFNLEMR